MKIFPRLFLLYPKSVSFILRRSTAASSHRKPASTATSRNTCGYRVSDERYVLQYVTWIWEVLV